MKNHNQGNYKFSDRKHPVQGILSVAMAFTAFVVLLVLCIMSGLQGGNGSLVYGLIGMFMLILTIIGFILAVLCFRKGDIYYSFPVTGTAMNSVLMIIYILLYIGGTVSV